MSGALSPRALAAVLRAIGRRGTAPRLPRTVARALNEANDEASLVDGVPIGTREFIDGVRTVHLDAESRQYIVGHNGEWVYGVWLLAPGAGEGCHGPLN
jgi:hypothetical protein